MLAQQEDGLLQVVEMVEPAFLEIIVRDSTFFSKLILTSQPRTRENAMKIP